MTTDADLVAFCRASKRVMFFLGRFPSFRREFIDQKIDKPTTPPEELREYEECAVGRVRRGTLLTVYFIFYFFKNFFFARCMLRLFDREDARVGTRPLEGGNYFQFACMISNCSRFSDEPGGYLERDLGYLPLFKICHPILSHYYTPVVNLGYTGLLIYSICTIGVTLIVVTLPFQQYFLPINNDVMMIIVAPISFAQMVCDRMCDLMVDVAKSLQFYRSAKLDRVQKYRRARSRFGSLAPPSSTLAGPNRRDYRSELLDLKLKLEHLTLRYAGFNAAIDPRSSEGSHLMMPSMKKENPFKECLPFFRTDWWRNRVVRAYAYLMAGHLLVFSLLSALVTVWLQLMLVERKELIDSFVATMARKNCMIWIRPDDDDDDDDSLGPGSQWVGSVGEPAPEQLLDLSQLSLTRWNAYAIFETVLALGSLLGTLAAMLAYYFTSYMELAGWQAELRRQLTLAIELTRIQALLTETAVVQSRLAATTGTRASTTATTLTANQPKKTRCRSVVAATGMATTNSEATSRALAAGPIFDCGDRSERDHDNTTTRGNAETELSFLRDPSSPFNRLFNKPMRVHKDYPAKTKLQHKIAYQRCALELWLTTRGQVSSPQVEMNERLYVTLRIFLESVANRSACMASFNIYSQLLAVALVLAVVYYSQRMPSYQNVHLFVVIFGLGISNFLILLASNFHANAKKINPLVWSLVAQTTKQPDDHDLRSEHMRYLWTKQVDFLDRNGGIVLSVFGVRITYVNIIQLIIWSGTVLVIAFKR